MIQVMEKGKGIALESLSTRFHHLSKKIDLAGEPD